jgi:hypothetical protein
MEKCGDGDFSKYNLRLIFCSVRIEENLKAIFRPPCAPYLEPLGWLTIFIDQKSVAN